MRKLQPKRRVHDEEEGRRLRATWSTCFQQDTRKKEIVGGLCTKCGYHLASEAAAAYGREALLPKGAGQCVTKVMHARLVRLCLSFRSGGV
jgi:hypothetical protein